VRRFNVARRSPIPGENDHKAESMQVIFWHAQVGAPQQVEQRCKVVARGCCNEREAAN
jgi:hypothetical protein